MKGVNLPRLQVKDFMAFKIPYPNDAELAETAVRIKDVEKEITIIDADLVNIDDEKEQILSKYLE